MQYTMIQQEPQAQDQHDNELVAGLLSLPRELLRRICKKHILGVIDVLSLSSTCSELRTIMWNDDRLWQYLYIQQWLGFPQVEKKVTDATSWRHMYATTKKWNITSLNTSQTIAFHTRGVTSLCLDEKYLFSGSHDNTIKVYRNDTLDVVGALEGHKYTIWALASDGISLYSGSNDHTIRVWNLSSLSCTHILEDHASKIFGLEIKGNVLFSSGDKIVKVWNRSTHKPLHTLEGHAGGVNAISVMNDILLTGASDKTLRLWDIHTMECTNILNTEAKILSLAATSNYIFTGDDRCRIKVWDHRSSTCVASGVAHNWEVWQLVLAGGYLFSGSFDHKISAWDIRGAFTTVRTFTGHRSYIHALTADNTRLFSGSADKSIRVWGDTPSVLESQA